MQQLWRQECNQSAARLAQVAPNITSTAHHQSLQDQQNSDLSQDHISSKETDHLLSQQTLESHNEERDSKLNPQADGSLDKQTSSSLNTQSDDNSLDTVVFPTLQMAPFGITNDSVVTNKFLSSSESGSTIQLASGYFNLTEEYMKCILHTSKASYNILMAHPKVNTCLFHLYSYEWI